MPRFVTGPSERDRLFAEIETLRRAAYEARDEAEFVRQFGCYELAAERENEAFDIEQRIAQLLQQFPEIYYWERPM